MVNDQWLILQHWRGGLQVLLVTKNCFIILGRRFVMWWERRIDSLVKGRIDSLVGGRIDSLVKGRIDSLVGGRIDSLVGRRIDSLVGGRIDSLVGGRIAIRPYMCDTTLVLGICWLHFSLFTFHHIPKLIRLATLFILHSSLFTTYPSSFAWLHFSLFILHSLYHCSSSERGILRGGWRHSTEPVRASGASS